MICSGMHSNVMLRFMVQAFQDPQLCSSNKNTIIIIPDSSLDLWEKNYGSGSVPRNNEILDIKLDDSGCGLRSGASHPTESGLPKISSRLRRSILEMLSEPSARSILSRFWILIAEFLELYIHTP